MCKYRQREGKKNVESRNNVNKREGTKEVPSSEYILCAKWGKIAVKWVEFVYFISDVSTLMTMTGCRGWTWRLIIKRLQQQKRPLLWQTCTFYGAGFFFLFFWTGSDVSSIPQYIDCSTKNEFNSFGFLILEKNTTSYNYATILRGRWFHCGKFSV